MKYCPNCHVENSDDSKYCKNCGAKLDQIEEESAEIGFPEAKGQKQDIRLEYDKKSYKTILTNTIRYAKYAFLGICFAGVCAVGYHFVSGINTMATAISKSLSSETINITNIIIKEKRGIQELAAAKADYTIERNIKEKQNLLLFDYIKKNFICDFHYTVKYGYDLSKISETDISENKLTKTVTIRLPKGGLISNELTKTNIRHNEGIAFDWNKVKAEDIDELQTNAKQEVAAKASADKELINLAEENTQKAFTNIVHGVSPDYKVVVIGN